MSTVKISIVVDNNSAPGFIEEHGFSLWIEVNGQQFLFDTGQGKGLLPNAKKLNLDLHTVEAVILSHGHYDHSGGIEPLLNSHHRIQLYCHPAAFLPRYAITTDNCRSITIPHATMASINLMEDEHIEWVTKPIKLSEDIGLTGEIPRLTTFEDTGGPFFLDKAGTRADPILDDIALWVQTEKGMLVCLGCCHSGIVNTLNYIKEITGESTIHTLVGGLHLLHSSKEKISTTIAELKKFDIQRLIPCHCTGSMATQMLTEELNCQPGFAGMSIEL